MENESERRKPATEGGSASGEETTRPQKDGEAATPRFGMENGDNTDVPATGVDPDRQSAADAAKSSGAKPEQDKDLRENPGIGQSKGAFARGGDLDDAEGENTVEGDVENDPGPQGQVNPDHRGRTNE